VLLLFDIDGTLMIKASREHAESLCFALQRIHGLSELPSERVEAAGRTDSAIARSILMLAGVSAEQIDARARDVQVLTCEEYARRCPKDLSDRVAPGVPDVLEELSARDDVELALVTGNYVDVAHRKLDAAGIGHFFPRGRGGFGSDSEDRSDLPSIARARAGDHPSSNTVVIGDTPRDIACARADNCHVIAISTGPFRAPDLHGADQIISTAREIPHALTRIPGLT
jgi:phosphoglycolate phosphatase-like HAD superfamily hydrolase